MEHSWTSLYRKRGVSQCMEATFDLIRENVTSWLGLGAVLFLPAAMGLAILMTLFKNTLFYEDGLEIFSLFTVVKYYFPFGHLLLFLGFWGAFLLQCTLLKASQEGRLPGKRMQLGEAWGYMRPLVVKTLVSALIFSLFIFLMLQQPLFFLLFVALGVPMMLLAPIWIVEDLSFADALSKSFRLGYSSWFQLMAILSLMTLLGFLMSFSVFMFWSLASMLMETVIVEGNTNYSFIAHVMVFVSSLLLMYAFFLIASMVLLSCVFDYGNVSELQDDTSIESDIENFENL